MLAEETKGSTLASREFIGALQHLPLAKALHLALQVDADGLSDPLHGVILKAQQELLKAGLPPTSPHFAQVMPKHLVDQAARLAASLYAECLAPHQAEDMMRLLVDSSQREEARQEARELANLNGCTPSELQLRLTESIEKFIGLRARVARLHRAHLDDEAFWEARESLSRIRQFARNRRVGPWALFGVALARISALIPPFVQMPPLIGDYGSLNMMVAIVAASGMGKGAAEAAGRQLIPNVPSVSAGSGEGLVRHFGRRTKTTDGWVLTRTADSVYLSVPEVDTLRALRAREGSTLIGILRSAWIGEQIGFGYADDEKRIEIPPHSYRVSAVIGVQPDRADWLLKDAAGGTPQRLLWMPVDDSNAPEARPDLPHFEFTLPRWPMSDMAGRVMLEVCDTAVQASDSDGLSKLRGTWTGAALDSHSNFNRLKVAAHLAVLDGRVYVDDDDWQLSELVMRKSSMTRDEVLTQLALTKRAESREQGLQRADAMKVTQEAVADRSVDRVAEVIVRGVKKHAGHDGKGCTQNCLKPMVASRDRHFAPDALESAISAGSVIFREGRWFPKGM
jgi:hypothetical protein